jgi:hypothetical protein
MLRAQQRLDEYVRLRNSLNSFSINNFRTQPRRNAERYASCLR